MANTIKNWISLNFRESEKNEKNTSNDIKSFFVKTAVRASKNFSKFINVKNKGKISNVCLAVEGRSSRMHLFHFMQNNLSFSDVTQSRFWIKLVVHSVLVTLSFAS